MLIENFGKVNLNLFNLLTINFNGYLLTIT